MGFYESIDFSRENSRNGKPRRRDLHLHGAPPGHEPARARQRLCIATSCSAAFIAICASAPSNRCCSSAFRSTPLSDEEAQPAVIRRRIAAAEEVPPTASGRKRLPFPACICTATGATRSWSPTPAAATAAGTISMSRAGAPTPRSIPGAASFISAICVPTTLWAATYQPVGGHLGTSSAALLRRPRRIPSPRFGHRNA